MKISIVLCMFVGVFLMPSGDQHRSAHMTISELGGKIAQGEFQDLEKMPPRVLVAGLHEAQKRLGGLTLLPDTLNDLKQKAIGDELDFGDLQWSMIVQHAALINDVDLLLDLLKMGFEYETKETKQFMYRGCAAVLDALARLVNEDPAETERISWPDMARILFVLSTRGCSTSRVELIEQVFADGNERETAARAALYLQHWPRNAMDTMEDVVEFIEDEDKKKLLENESKVDDNVLDYALKSDVGSLIRLHLSAAALDQDNALFFKKFPIEHWDDADRILLLWAQHYQHAGSRLIDERLLQSLQQYVEPWKKTMEYRLRPSEILSYYLDSGQFDLGKELLDFSERNPELVDVDYDPQDFAAIRQFHE